MNHHTARPEVGERDRGYRWSPRQNKWGLQRKHWRLRLDKRVVARIYEDEAGMLSLICYDRPDGTEVGLAASGSQDIDKLKARAIQWCNKRYGVRHETASTDEDTHPGLLPDQPLRSDAAQVVVHAAAGGAATEADRQDIPAQHCHASGEED
jgi:hypothetical protein